MSPVVLKKDENGNEKKQQVIVVLEGACLETVKSKKVEVKRMSYNEQGYVLLNADDHKAIHKKLGPDASESRPDICHQVICIFQL